MAEPVADVDRDSFEDLVQGREGITVIDVWGPRCQPCLALDPVYRGLAERHGERARFLKLRADTNRMLCAQLRVMSLPTFLCFEDGEEFDRLTGEVSSGELETWIEKWVDGRN